MRHVRKLDRKQRKLAQALGEVDTWTCPSPWCHRPLDVTTDGNGNVVANPCDGCARVAKGRCYHCGDWRHSQNSPYCLRCALKQFEDSMVSMADMDELVAAEPAEDPTKLRYAEKRQEILERNRRKRAAKKAQDSMAMLVPRTKRCEVPGCANVITYFTRPPRWCDSHWWEYAQKKRDVKNEQKRNWAGRQRREA